MIHTPPHTHTTTTPTHKKKMTFLIDKQVNQWLCVYLLCYGNNEIISDDNKALHLIVASSRYICPKKRNICRCNATTDLHWMPRSISLVVTINPIAQKQKEGRNPIMIYQLHGKEGFPNNLSRKEEHPRY